MKNKLLYLLLFASVNLFAQINNYSLELDGVNDYLALGSNDLITSPTLPNTISCWFKNKDPFQTFEVIFGSRILPEAGYSLYYRHTSNPSIGGYSFYRGGEKIDFQISDNEAWHHLAITSDETFQKLYLDGSIVDSVSFSQAGISSPGLFLGTDSDFNGNAESCCFSNVLIDDFTIWNTPLSQKLILHFINCPPTGNEFGLVGYWNFEEGEGTITNDLTSNNNDGTLTNGATWSQDVPFYECNTTDVIDDCGECLPPTDPNFNQSCIDCNGLPNGTAIIDDCGECLEPTDPNFNQSCIDCNGLPNGTAIIDVCGECLEPTDPNFNQSCIDCNGLSNGTAIIDVCGECLEPTDPNFNQSCLDCNGLPNGTAIVDVCGECLPPTDPNFNQSCADCNGLSNGTAIIDVCGECLEPTDPNFNQSCLDCNGLPNGTAIIDVCGECLEPTDPDFNQSCADCNGLSNGTAIIDVCGECLEPTDPNFNQSCLDCNGLPNGTAIVDDCGECLEPTDPNFNQSCADCNGVPNGTAIIDVCGECLEEDDPNFNQSCLDCNGVLNGTAILNNCDECLDPNDPNFIQICLDKCAIYIPNIFSPNGDGYNDKFQIFKQNDTEAQIKTFLIFDRWGSLIYELRDLEFNANINWWDGSFNEKIMSNGVYIYFIQINFSNQKLTEYKGTVTIAK